MGTGKRSDLEYRALQIFGKEVQVGLDRSEGSRILADEISLYPAGHSDLEPELVINHAPLALNSAGYTNPASHWTLKDGFITKSSRGDIYFHLDSAHRLTHIDFQDQPEKGWWWSQVSRFANIQFADAIQSIGQTFHELIMVPSVYFDPRRFLVHASAFEAPSGGIIMIGGTGGVGKTSLALALCREHGYRFVNDDIAVISEEGHVWPNLAYPKIYAYNVEGNLPLKRQIVGQGGWLNQFHWQFHLQLGPDRVRRRVSPQALFGTYSPLGGRLQQYILLVREDRSDLLVEPMEAAQAAHLSRLVIETEQYAMKNHFLWDAYNRIVNQEVPSLLISDVFDRWERLARQVFSNAECLILHVPRQMDHLTFKDRVVSLITTGTF
ncbi:MAG: hypothetical protein K8J31_11985 [Anaerolineae bacterium]|nr:hypothetical protein [Anaerolineae bacterium]